MYENQAFCYNNFMSKEISSLQHAHVKHLVKLRDNKEYRYAQKKLVISGVKLIRELSEQFRFYSLILEKESAHLFSYNAHETFLVPRQVLKKITGLENPEPIAAEIQMPGQANLQKCQFLLILDGISDPGNLGTLLRTAKALDWCGAYVTQSSVDPYNEKALRSAKGATFTLPIMQGSWDELQKLLSNNNMALFAADCQGEDFTRCTGKAPLALAIGNEAHGLCADLKKAARAISVPMNGTMESLNAAIAGGILMHGLKR